MDYESLSELLLKELEASVGGRGSGAGTTTDQTNLLLKPERILSQESSSYLKTLPGLSLEALRSQPQLLSSKSTSLERQLSELCISQSQAFVDLQIAKRSLPHRLGSIRSRLDRLINESIPRLSQASQDFLSRSGPCLERRQEVSNLSEQYRSGGLSNLLQLPNLVETCLKARHYTEALQLASYLASISLPSSKTSSTTTPSWSDSPFVRSLLFQVWNSLSKLKEDLTWTFSTPGLKLPSAKRSVSHLRRLSQLDEIVGSFPPDTHHPLDPSLPPDLGNLPTLGLTESQLCLSFLRSRWDHVSHNLEQVLSSSKPLPVEREGGAEAGSVPDLLKKYIETWREGVSDTISMSWALFLDPTANTTGNPVGPSHQISLCYRLVSSYATQSVERLREVLESRLKRFGEGPLPQDGNSRDDILTLSELHTQLSYVSTSLSRYGLDFSPLLCSNLDPGSAQTSPLESACFRLFRRSFQSVVDEFESSIPSPVSSETSEEEEEEQGGSKKKTGSMIQPSEWMVKSKQDMIEVIDSPLTLFSIDRVNLLESNFEPNLHLLDHFPPLEKLLEGSLSALGELSLFSPLGLESMVSELIESNFQRLIEKLSRYSGSLRDNFTSKDSNEDEDEEALSSRMIRSLVDSIFPLLKAVLHSGIYPSRNGDEVERIRGKVSSPHLSDLVDRVLEEVEESERKRVENAERRVKEREERRLEEERRKKEEEERKRKEEEEKRKVEEEERKRKEEERKRKEEEEERLRMEEEERKRKEEEEKRRVEEGERKRKEEEEERLREEEERLRVEEEERKRKEEEEEKRRVEEEERKRKEEEEEKLRAEEEERKRKEEEEKRKTEEEEEGKRGMEQKKKEEEDLRTEKPVETLSFTNEEEEQVPEGKEEEMNSNLERKEEEGSGISKNKGKLAEILRSRREERERQLETSGVEEEEEEELEEEEEISVPSTPNLSGKEGEVGGVKKKKRKKKKKKG
ncbi:hypothetical protein IE53DRAFT_364050 [Violaceomyces palustris]|uniref:Uncharacterized protein n=1 Tax=Violaceomyces palustris TaxID=1673888 RepID=A0ACD0NR25_9BASI|nr:hypothetical protein IE53DRAFT_364050 [Violaceomyces palustris]